MPTKYPHSLSKMKILKLIFLMALSVSALSCNGNAPSIQLLDATEFAEYIQMTPNLTLVDVRSPEEFAAGHIPGAINIDFSDEDFVEDLMTKVAADKHLAIYCRTGHRSGEAAETLKAKGRSVMELKGGIIEWQNVLLPLTTGKEDLYLTPGGKNVTIQPLIHASIRIVFDGKEIEVDPVGTLGNRTTDYSQMPKADLILVTHEHHDHLDPAAIKTLSKADTIVIANPNSAEILGYGMAMRNGDRKTLADGIELEAVPAYNTSADKLQFHPRGRDNGYILSLDGLRIYIAGDTEPIPEMKDLGKIDIAFLPCNLPYTMTPSQLIEAARIVRPGVLYPYHFGTTDLSSITPALAPDGIYVRICPFDP